jgi:RNA polymerase sigma-70 factor (ECF subfamily)
VNYVTRNTAKNIEKKSVNFSDIETISESENDYSFHQMKVDNLKKALELISPEEKMILLLKYQDYLSIKEIENVLDISESAVKMRLKRAKDKLINVYINIKD